MGMELSLSIQARNGSIDPGDINNLDDDNDGFIDNLIGWNAHSNEGDIGVNLSLSHGTNVAGCVSSMTNNETGIASVGWSIKIMGITNCDPGGSITSGYEGILTAAQMRADIINNSWGSSGGPDYAQALINTVLNEYTSLIVASSGNAGTNIANYPAAFEGVVSKYQQVKVASLVVGLPDMRQLILQLQVTMYLQQQPRRMMDFIIIMQQEPLSRHLLFRERSVY